MNQSESIANLGAALVAAQAEVEHAHKNAQNTHLKNRYADLNAVRDAIVPVFAKHGLAVVQMPGYDDGLVTVETQLIHSSGEWLRGTAAAPAQKQDPQGVGSALTYLRRYSLAALACIGQEDDDGQAASQPRRREEMSKVRRDPIVIDCNNPERGPLVSEAQRRRLFAIATETGYTQDGLKRMLFAEFGGITSSKDITRDQYDAACALAENKEAAANYNGGDRV